MNGGDVGAVVEAFERTRLLADVPVLRLPGACTAAVGDEARAAAGTDRPVGRPGAAAADWSRRKAAPTMCRGWQRRARGQPRPRG